MEKELTKDQHTALKNCYFQFEPNVVMPNSKVILRVEERKIRTFLHFFDGNDKVPKRHWVLDCILTAHKQASMQKHLEFAFAKFPPCEKHEVFKDVTRVVLLSKIMENGKHYKPLFSTTYKRSGKKWIEL